MKIYNYDKDSLEFLFVSEAQLNPKNKDSYLFPKYSTTIIPPVLLKNEAAIFVDGIWKIVSDYRGEKIVNLKTNEESIVDYLGNIPEEFMLYKDYVKTDVYKKHLEDIQKENIKNDILENIKTLDEKRIRALCEPSIKDEATGETWLDFYNKQVMELRKKLSEVDYDD